MEGERKYTPIVQWADNGKLINLTIELSDTHKNPSISLTEESLNFKGFGHGAHGENLYQLDIEFFNKVDYKHSTCKVTDRNIQFDILKQYTKESWPRLLKRKEKPAWLRIDFDKWKIEDSEEENMSEKIDKITFEQHVRNEFDKAKDDIKVFARIAWLTMYNLFQAICYTIIFAKLIIGLYTQGTDVVDTFYEGVSDLFLSCQIAAFAEVLHPILGVVKTGITAPLLQVSGRSFVLFVLVMPMKEMHTNPIVFILLCLYSFIEIIRYPFYLFALYRINNKLINWIRYSIWIPLYPSGITCEVIIMIQSLPLSEEIRRWEHPMPNMFNYYFSLAAFIKCILPPFIALSLFLINHMWKLRCKKLTGKPKVKKQ